MANRDTEAFRMIDQARHPALNHIEPDAPVPHGLECGYAHRDVFGPGWWCSCLYGHDGPCALWPIQATVRKTIRLTRRAHLLFMGWTMSLGFVAGLLWDGVWIHR
ncbi:MAG: hypothetical protein M3O41_00495 [Pseudomonadota bacterium]|nr:hypothetical protein [Pseudomonadota bacterium]